MKKIIDNINHPAHYTDGGIETIDFIESKNLPYHLGNVIKYISRAGKKNDRIEDLKKAQWYLNRYIKISEDNTKCIKKEKADGDYAVLADVDKLLSEYTQYLYDHGYLDDDWWAEQPSPILEFINKKFVNVI